MNTPSFCFCPYCGTEYPIGETTCRVHPSAVLIPEPEDWQAFFGIALRYVVSGWTQVDDVALEAWMAKGEEEPCPKP